MLEATWLENLIQKKTYVRVYLLNGYQLRGRIVGQDENVITLHMNKDDVDALIFKCGILSILPSKEVAFF